MRQMLKQIVAGLASEVYEACDGREAVEVYAAQRPKCVLMDVRMQRLDGIRATAEITARFPEARVLILSQYEDPELRTAAEEAGAAGYLLKEDLSQLPALLHALSSGDANL